MNNPRAGQTKNAQNLDWHGLTTGVGVARSTTHRYLQELSDRNLIDYGRDRACSAGGRRLRKSLEGGLSRNPERKTKVCFDHLRLERGIKKARNRLDYRLFRWRRVRDSNPRDLSVYSISSAAPSTTRTTLRIYFHPCFLPKNCSKIRWGENRRESKKYSILRFSVLRNIKEKRGDEIPSFCRNFESTPL